MSPLRVLIRSGSARSRANYRELVGHDGTIRLVSDPSEADVVLHDLTDSSRNGAGSLEVDQATLVLVPEGASPALAAELAARGASLVSDGVSREQLVIALKATASGLVVRDLASMPAQPVQAQLAPGETESLTEREHEILRLVGEGMVNRDIARALGLSDHTVKFHLHSIFRKLGARSRTEAVSLAIRRGLLML